MRPKTRTDTVGPESPLLPKITVGDDSPVLSDLRIRLASEATRTSWGALAGFYGVNKGILWRIANQGYEPKRPTIRQALGLPPLVSLSPANGAIAEPGSVFLRSSLICACGCGASFIPRHPRQRYLPGHRRRG